MDKVLMYVCLAGLIPLLVILAGIGYDRLELRLFGKFKKAIRHVSILGLLMVGPGVLKLIGYGGSKAPTNSPTAGDGIPTNAVVIVEGGETNGVEVVGGGSTNDWGIVEGGDTNLTEVVEDETPTNPPPMMAMGPRRTTSVQQQGFTAEEIAAGVVMAREGSNEVWSAEPPEGAVVIGDWVKHGAFDDWVAMESVRREVWAVTGGVETTSVQQQVGATGVVERIEWAVFSRGRVVKCVSTSNGVETTEWRLLEGLGLTNEVVSVLPECRWGTNGPSRVWYKATDIGSVLVGWQNALLGQDTNGVVGIVGEFYGDGNWRVKYDWSRFGGSLGAEASLSGRDLGWTNVTSRYLPQVETRGLAGTRLGWGRALELRRDHEAWNVAASL